MRVIFALILTFIATFGGPVLAAQYEKIDKLKDQIINIQNAGKLGVRNLTMCRKVLGYGVYVPYSANVASKGAVIFFYYEIENIFTNKSKNKYSVSFSQDAILTNSEGVELLNKPKIIKMNYNSNKPMLNLYATFELDLASAEPGDYIYKLVLYDELKGAKAKAEFPFTIK